MPTTQIVPKTLSRIPESVRISTISVGVAGVEKMHGELVRETRGRLSLIMMLPSEQDDSQKPVPNGMAAIKAF